MDQFLDTRIVNTLVRVQLGIILIPGKFDIFPFRIAQDFDIPFEKVKANPEVPTTLLGNRS